MKGTLKTCLSIVAFPYKSNTWRLLKKKILCTLRALCTIGQAMQQYVGSRSSYQITNDFWLGKKQDNNILTTKVDYSPNIQVFVWATLVVPAHCNNVKLFCLLHPFTLKCSSVVLTRIQDSFLILASSFIVPLPLTYY